MEIYNRNICEYWNIWKCINIHKYTQIQKYMAHKYTQIQKYMELGIPIFAYILTFLSCRLKTYLRKWPPCGESCDPSTRSTWVSCVLDSTWICQCSSRTWWLCFEDPRLSTTLKQRTWSFRWRWTSIWKWLGPVPYDCQHLPLFRDHQRTCLCETFCGYGAFVGLVSIKNKKTLIPAGTHILWILQDKLVIHTLKIEAYQWVWCFYWSCFNKNQKTMIPGATYQKQKSVNILYQYRNINQYIIEI